MSRVRRDPFLDVVPRRSTWIKGGGDLLASGLKSWLMDCLIVSSLTSSMVKAGAKMQGGYGDGDGNREKPLICDFFMWVGRCGKRECWLQSSGLGMRACQ